MTTNGKFPLSRAHAQRGATAIEFAFLFVIFFALFYAILGYAFVILLQQGMVQAAAEGARAVVRLDPTTFTTDPAYEAAAQAVAKDAVKNAIAWMPQKARTALTSTSGLTATWVTSPVTYSTGAGNATVNAKFITVKLTYANYPTNPILPMISLPGLGTIPKVPTNLVVKSTLRITP